MAEAFPLQWPEGWPRTKWPERSRFDCRFGQVRDGIVRQLHLMGVPDFYVVISTNIPTRRDGLPYARTTEPDDCGVAVYWKDGGQQRVMACDRWDRVRDNMRAIEKTLEAMRGIDRWGTSDIVERAFSGFQALPPALEGWRAILGDCETLEEANRQWKALAFKAHPDRGGSETEMYRINHAWSEASRELGA